MRATKRTPGKVNLCLMVGPRQEGGLHELFTIFVPVSVYDVLDFTLDAHPGAAETSRIVCECKTSPGEDNLATRALRTLEQHTGWALEGRIVIQKGIPVGAGMGGGSSDAAAALQAGAQAVAEAGGPVLARAQLVAIAREVGADVAFFLDPRPSVGRGIGELLEPIELPRFSVVLVFSDRMLATGRVYGTFDVLNPGETQGVFDFRSSQAEKRWRRAEDAAQAARLLENDLEQASFSLIPALAAHREVLAREGALGALMSGSGPTLFGLCGTVEKAEELQRKMVERGFNAKVAGIVG